MAVPNHPLAGKFDDDPRVSFDKTAGKYQYEDDHGQEWEWAEHAWIPIVRFHVERHKAGDAMYKSASWISPFWG